MMAAVPRQHNEMQNTQFLSELHIHTIDASDNTSRAVLDEERDRVARIFESMDPSADRYDFESMESSASSNAILERFYRICPV